MIAAVQLHHSSQSEVQNLLEGCPEFAALNDSDGRGGGGGEAEVQQPVAGVQPGTEGVGGMATFEVRACVSNLQVPAVQ